MKQTMRARRTGVSVLALGTLAAGTSAFVIAGALPGAAADLRVSIGEAGLLGAVFAVSFAVLSPVLAAFVGGWPRRRVFLTGLAVLVVGNAATAIAPSYEWALAARALAAVGAAMVTPAAMATAAALAQPQRRSQAMSMVVLGLTLSSALGVPIGTLLGAVLTWRGTMWFVAALGVVAAVAIGVWLKAPPQPPVYGVRERLAPVRDYRVCLVLLATVTLLTGIYCFYSYVGVVFGQATDGRGDLLAILLFVSGCSGTVGNLLVGRLTDRFGPRRVIAAVAAVSAANFAVMPWLGTTWAGALVAVAVYGATAWGFTVPQQNRLVAFDPSAASLSLSLNASGIYIAMSLGGVVGAGALQIIDGSHLPWVAAVLMLFGLGVSEISYRVFPKSEENSADFVGTAS
jgi:MFS transporter, DHA1 family, inner membrane transport protein